MEVSGQLHAWLALIPRKNPSTNLLRRWVGTRTSQVILEKRRVSVALREFEPLTVQPVA